MQGFGQGLNRVMPAAAAATAVVEVVLLMIMTMTMVKVVLWLNRHIGGRRSGQVSTAFALGWGPGFAQHCFP